MKIEYYPGYYQPYYRNYHNTEISIERMEIAMKGYHPSKYTLYLCNEYAKNKIWC